MPLLINVDINNFNINICNLCFWANFWKSMHVRGSMVDTNILKYLFMVLTMKMFLMTKKGNF